MPKISCAWDYRSGLIFRRQSQWVVKTPSDSVFEATVYKQRNAIEHVSASTHTEPNFLASESFPWLWDVLKWFVEFGMSLQQVMPPIWNHRKFSLFHRHAGFRHQNYRSQSRINL